MNIKKRWLIGALLILSLVAFVGCSDDGEELSDMEIFERAFMQNLERHSYEFTGEMGLMVEYLNMPDQSLGSMLGAFNNMSMNFEGMINGEDLMDPEMYMSGQFNAAGMGVAMEMYMLEEQIAIKAPMMAQIMGDQRLADGYLIMDLEEDFYNQEGFEEMDPRDQEELYGMLQQFGEIYMEIVEEEFITNEGETEIEINEESLDVQEFEIYMGREEIRTVLESIPELMEEESFRELLTEVARISDGEIPVEEMEQELDRFIEEFDQEKVDEVMDELDQVLDFEESYFSMTLYIDEDYNIVKEQYDVNIVVDQEETAFSLQILGGMEYWNINGDIDIEAPEFTDENSVPLQELMFAPGF
ncbi:hypothetical protein [Isachenkonia alkalipeptolytica]|uniref:Uncharacterized protein n=1 Tax=Isachenkonia alkalipeptolytica TaxID=2565777 RepID=A0AA44BDV0_9CLOT|nr:hypothetical protein [Isachenkonia alkalipeptolytica]NBG87450.1 hypothetical protein [Isachenkonia alkalipeptolytica]